MENFECKRQAFYANGFTVINHFFSPATVQKILDIVETASSGNSSFRKAENLLAIRQLLLQIPELKSLLFSNEMSDIIRYFFGDDYFIIKSIYFDKPPESNWFVPFHQDITIAVKNKTELKGYHLWTVKQNQFAVQPPTEILEHNFTVRVHLDDTNKDNGALRVISGSHKKGIIRPETLERRAGDETICEVEKGGLMLIKPLLFHASDKTVNNSRRRVIHIEFGNHVLPSPLQWAEYMKVND